MTTEPTHTFVSSGELRINNSDLDIETYMPANDKVLLDSTSDKWNFSSMIKKGQTFVILEREYLDIGARTFREILCANGTKGFVNIARVLRLTTKV